MLHDAGWATPTWPVEYGGRGVGALEATILLEVLADCEAPFPQPSGGELLLGPTILHWGTEEQKARFLPRIAHAQDTWCQGFSEPDAGSDLASLQTRAVRDGDDWVLSGHKIWTSQAEDADFMFTLARTLVPQLGPTGAALVVVGGFIVALIAVFGLVTALVDLVHRRRERHP